MTARQSAGIVLFRRTPDGAVEVLLAHLGGPYWQRKDTGAWTIPKGEYDHAEDAFAAASREFTEELGHPLPEAKAVGLGTVRQGAGKVVTAWAMEGDLDPETVVSNEFELEWPPRSGIRAWFPEIDRAAWFALEDARARIVAGQRPLLDRLEEAVQPSGAGPGPPQVVGDARIQRQPDAGSG